MKLVVFGFLALFGADAFACSLAYVPNEIIKDKLSKGIADEIGVDVSDLKIELTEPELHEPYPLGADCSGLDSMHRSAGFKASYFGTEYQGVAVLFGYGVESRVSAKAVVKRSE